MDLIAVSKMMSSSFSRSREELIVFAASMSRFSLLMCCFQIFDRPVKFIHDRLDQALRNRLVTLFRMFNWMMLFDFSMLSKSCLLILAQVVGSTAVVRAERT